MPIVKAEDSDQKPPLMPANPIFFTYYSKQVKNILTI